MRKIVLTFGLIGGGFLAAVMWLTLPFADQLGHSEVIGYTAMVLAFLMVYFGVRSYRDNVAAGNITFGKAFQVGLLITVVISACYVLSWEILYFNFLPDFADKYAAIALEKARAAGASAEALAAQSAKMEEFKQAYRNPLINITYTLIEIFPVGLLFAFGTAWAMSRKRTANPPAAVVGSAG